MKRKRDAGKATDKQKMKPDEVLQAGPLTLARLGRLTMAQVKWDPTALKQMQAALPKRREDLKKQIDTSVTQLVELFRSCDPLPLLCMLFARNCLVDPETYSEPEHDGRESRVEYAQSLVMAVKDHGTTLPDDAQWDQFEKNVDSVLDAITWHFAMRDAGQRTSVDETKFIGLMHLLFIRGSSILEHDSDLVRDLFVPHDALLEKHFGFNTASLVEFCENTTESIQRRIREQCEAWSGLKDLHRDFVELTDARPELTAKEVMDILRASDRAAGKIERSKEVLGGGVVPAHEVDASGSVASAICERLSLKPGDNEDFLLFAKSPGWPTNDTQVHARPLVLRGGKYYCPSPVLLTRNRATILEEAVRDANSEYFGKQYAKARGKTAEKLALAHLRRLMPRAEIYPSVYYRMDEDGKEQRFEADGLVLMDDRLLILEVKSAPMSLAARRGADKGLKNDLTHLVGEPYQQASRTLRFLKSRESSVFEAEDGSPILTISGLSRFRRVYLVNVTLADISHVAARLNCAKEMGLLGGVIWPWSVYVNDLRVISEILDSPSEFFLYLERRLKLNEMPAIASSDELDYLGMFLKDGLFFTPKDVAGVSRFSMVGYTVAIDRYYDKLAGRVETGGEKPLLNISPWYRELIRSLERTEKTGAYHVGNLLLSFDGMEQDRIEKWVQEYGRLSTQDGKSHTLTMVGRDTPPLVFRVVPAPDQADDRLHADYADMKRMQLKADSLVMVSLVRGEVPTVTFDIFEGPLTDPAGTAVKLESFRRAKYRDYVLQVGRQPERNDPCSCNSDMKFKKCCLRDVWRWRN